MRVKGARGDASQEFPSIPGKLKPCGADAHQLLEAGDRLGQGCWGKLKLKKKHLFQSLSFSSRATGCFSSLQRPVEREEQIFLRGRRKSQEGAWAELHRAIIHHAITIFFLATPDLLDMSRMILRTEGPQCLPRGYKIILYVPVSDADKVGVYYVQSKSFLTSSSASSSSFVVLLRSL